MKNKNNIIYVIIAILLIVVITLTVILICKNKEEKENNIDNDNNINASNSIISDLNKDEEKEDINVNKQIKVIVDNKDLWLEEDDDFINYVYAITDLDQNGRLEIMSTSNQGSGMYSYNNFFELNTNLDGLNKIVTDIEEGDSQSEIGIDKTQVFFDEVNNKYYYIFNDVIRINSYEYENSKKVIMLNNGFITDDMIAYKTTVYKNETDDPIEKYYDKDDNIISKEQFERVDKLIYGKMIEKEVTFNWNKIPKNTANNQIISVLTKSYTKFTLKNV